MKYGEEVVFIAAACDFFLRCGGRNRAKATKLK